MSDNISQMHSREEIDGELEIVDYAAGRLGDEQARAFEARLASDPELAAMLGEERALRGSLEMLETGDMPPARAFEAIAGKLDDGPKRSLWLPAIAAGIVAVIAVAFLMQGPNESALERDVFETLSNDGATAVEVDNRYRIVFAESVDASAREATARALGFDIVSGPGAGGAFVVESSSLVSQERLREWRQDARIELAEPVRYD
ncbi:MAG: hypothetical protein QNJ05_09110 [Woeseiaceae bacterium]|nr:hypothetical protein [Woeseiaceae bacterium]